MSRSTPFTEEQMEILRNNPYTHSVSPLQISFTVDFKKFFYKQTQKIPPVTTKNIFRAAGYDPSWFTQDNLDAIRKRILVEAVSPNGFKPPRGLSTAERTALFAEKDLSKQKTEESLKELQERIVHLEQQIEFLKKISHVQKMKTPPE